MCELGFGSARKAEIESYRAGCYDLGTRRVRVPYAEGNPRVIDLARPPHLFLGVEG